MTDPSSLRVLSAVEFGGVRHEPGEDLEREILAHHDVDVDRLLADGVLGSPDDEGVESAMTGILAAAIGVLRDGSPEQLLRFIGTLRDDEVISAKLAEAAEADDGTPGREARLIAAIGGLEEGNEAHWTTSGKPEVRALRAATGLDDVSAAERDAVWGEFQRAKEGTE